MLKLNEPQWWVDILTSLNTLMHNNEILFAITPMASDIFVFTYPIYLLALYLWGIKKKKAYYKNAALFVFSGAVVVYVINMIIQSFVEKTRPDVVLELIADSREFLVLSKLPSDTFPSDHAAVSMAIAVATLVWGIRKKDKIFRRLSIIFFVFSIIMWLGRITLGIHWPTDILMGMAIGLIVPSVLWLPCIYELLQKYIFSYVIKLQEWVWKKVF